MNFVVNAVHRLYKWTLSPFFGGCCRFHPSCSDYAREAILLHGMCKGGWLTLRRVSRCHPGHPGGVDLVPNNLSPHQPQ